MHKVVVHRRAARYLERLPPEDRTRIKSLLAQLRDRPTRHPGVIPMHGEWSGYWRLRAGGLRVLFWVDDAKETVYVDHIGPRGDVYK
jgi:mRNA interferase RelE/StbE